VKRSLQTVSMKASSAGEDGVLRLCRVLLDCDQRSLALPDFLIGVRVICNTRTWLMHDYAVRTLLVNINLPGFGRTDDVGLISDETVGDDAGGGGDSGGGGGGCGAKRPSL
jgi:hypothetical protein